MVEKEQELTLEQSYDGRGINFVDRLHDKCMYVYALKVSQL